MSLELAASKTLISNGTAVKSERIKPKVILRKFSDGENGFKVDNNFEAGLAGVVNDIFQARSMELVKSPLSNKWGKLAYVIIMSPYENVFRPQEGNFDAIAGLLTGFIAYPTALPIVVEDTIGLRKDYRGFDFLPEMMYAAYCANRDITPVHNSRIKGAIPAGLRTTSEKADKRYSSVGASEKIDKRFSVLRDWKRRAFEPSDRISQTTFVHLYGLNRPTIGKPRPEYAPLEGVIMEYLASLPKKFGQK